MHFDIEERIKRGERYTVGEVAGFSEMQLVGDDAFNGLDLRKLFDAVRDREPFF
jgi:hypothetical protein